MTNKLTPAQQLVLNALLSIIGGAITAGITALYQSYSVQGVNIGALLNVFMVTFLAFFGKSLYDFVPGHIQQTIQALEDTANELRLSLQASTPVQPVIIPSVQKSSVVASRSVPTTLANMAQSVNQAMPITSQIEMGPIAATPIDEEDTAVRPVVKQVL